MTDIRTKVRNILGDFSTTESDVFTYGTSSVFTLTESNPIAITTLLINDSEVDDSDYSFDSDTNKVTVAASLTSGDTVEIRYTYYPNYSDTELTNRIQAALTQISVTNLYTFVYDSEDDAIYPTPEEKEENLIATITAILINPDNRTYRLPDITINVPSDLPTDQKIRRTIAIYKKNVHGVFSI